MIKTEAEIISNERLAEDCWRIALDAPQIASEVKPGQFINIKILKNNDPILRRPFSVFRSVKRNGVAIGVEVIYKVVGRGTEDLSHLCPGEKLDIIGPIGHGFERNQSKKVHVLIAGGVGSSSLFMLGEEISRLAKEKKLELYILLGAQAKNALILENEFNALNARVMVATDDGTYGYHGLVTDNLRNAFERGSIPADCAIYACGPEPMLKTLSRMHQDYGFPAQIAMERRMLCGIGACVACVCKVDKKGVLKYRDIPSSHIQLSPEEDFGYALVCQDGPVFNIEEIRFDE